ncbi:MAG: ATP-grasp domain-containing protein [Phycisphaeraceae bacterium]|nr:ATP-grasp domain-containing protein [Phycisphaeraceae bacterium]
MRPSRIVVMMHQDLVPPENFEDLSDQDLLHCKTEYDVLATLNNLGHEVRPLGVYSDLGVIRDTLTEFKPKIVFNLLEEFHGESLFDQHVVSYLELLRQPYTGCNPRGLTLAHDKALSKKICAYHRITVPTFAVFPRGRKARKPKSLDFPLIVKSLTLEGSIGIAQSSVVYDEKPLQERVEFVHEQIGTDAIAEQFIEGRELYVGVLGNRRLRTFPVWELVFNSKPSKTNFIATGKIKWDMSYRRRLGVDTRRASDLTDEQERKIRQEAKRICRTLDITGYARLDFRLTEAGKLYLLEANPNPDLSYGEDFAESAEVDGLKYPELLERIIKLGLSHAKGKG